jgi:hypothetical protein
LIPRDMFDKQPTNPQILENLLNLSDSWKELLGPSDVEKPKKKRAPAKKKTKSS